MIKFKSWKRGKVINWDTSRINIFINHSKKYLKSMLGRKICVPNIVSLNYYIDLVYVKLIDFISIITYIG